MAEQTNVKKPVTQQLSSDTNTSSSDQIIHSKDDHKSDTDSGRSSIHYEKEIDSIKPTVKSVSRLKVSRCTDDKVKALGLLEQRYANLIGEVNDGVAKKTNTENVQGKLQVTRRKDAILKRRNMHRRNTIDVSQYEMQKAAHKLETKFNASNSTNCLDKIGADAPDNVYGRIDQMNANRFSMPGNIC